MPAPAPPAPLAVVGGRLCTDLVDVTDDLAALDGDGFWAVVLPFDGPPVCARFATRPAGDAVAGAALAGPADRRLDHLARPRPATATASRHPRGDRRRRRVPGEPVPGPRRSPAARTPTSPPSAPRSPRATRRRTRRSSGCPPTASRSPRRRPSGSCAATATSSSPRPSRARRPTPDGFLAKDRAENVMIVDLVRNDLGRVCEWGIGRGAEPAGRRAPPRPPPPGVDRAGPAAARAAGGPRSIAATFPPGSVTGAPKLAALAAIDRLETGVAGGLLRRRRAGSTPTAGAGDLNVAIRTFWLGSDGEVRFGTGGGITWDSTPEGEWEETELKAAQPHPGRQRHGGDVTRPDRRGSATGSSTSTTPASPSTTAASPPATAASRR